MGSVDIEPKKRQLTLKCYLPQETSNETITTLTVREFIGMKFLTIKVH